MSTGNRKRRRELGLLPEPGKCVARSSRTGQPCRLPPVKGAAVCHKHGGSAPQVQRKAAERIAHASDIAVLQILALMQAPDTPAPVKLAAARDLLDRANVSGKQSIEIETPLWRELLEGIVATVPTEGAVPIRPFVEARDPLVVEAERADEKEKLAELAEELDRYQTIEEERPETRPAPAPPPTAPIGDDRPPPRHPTPGPRRIEPGDDPLSPAYRPTPRSPRKGRIAGRR